MTLTDFKASLKSQNVSGTYVFSGEEDYLKKFYLKEFANICCPDDSFALFNQVIFDGNEIDIADVAEAIKSPPMMGVCLLFLIITQFVKKGKTHFFFPLHILSGKSTYGG